jgi:formylglycine-generating enzyme required for sulfatase activity
MSVRVAIGVILLSLGAGPAAAQATAAAPQATATLRDCPHCPELTVVPAGTFMLGTSADTWEYDPGTGETPPVAVTIQRPFAIGRYEVTVAQYRAFVAATGHATHSLCRVWSGRWLQQPERDWRNPGFGAPAADTEPVSCVSWDDARAYVEWLSRTTGRKYRLPSEAEWEYAARGGTGWPRYWGDRDSHEGVALSLACDYANVYDSSAIATQQMPWPNARCSDHYATIAPVGRFKPNAFDAYDMIGNLREWVQDCYTASYQERPQDGRAWEWTGGCELRGVRGGSWATRPALSRAAVRGAEMQGTRQSDLGFRVARDLEMQVAPSP